MDRVLAAAEAAHLAPVETSPWSHDVWPVVMRLANQLDGLLANQLDRQSAAVASDCAQKILAAAPSAAELAAYRDQLADAISLDRADVPATKASVGMMIDAFPHSSPPSLEVYFGAMVHDIVESGFSPAVVVGACRQLRRTLKYPPPISEMLVACQKARGSLLTRAASAARLLDIVAWAEQIAAALAADTPA
jgi:hypothetical protein